MAVIYEAARIQFHGMLEVMAVAVLVSWGGGDPSVHLSNFDTSHLTSALEKGEVSVQQVRRCSKTGGELHFTFGKPESEGRGSFLVRGLFGYLRL